MRNDASFMVEPLEARALFSVGEFDPGFNHGALETTAFADGSSVVTDIEVLPDGGFITAGTVRVRDGNNPTQQTKLAIAKYRFDGSLDTSFGVGGKIENTPRSMTGAVELELTPDGGFIVMGSALTYPDTTDTTDNPTVSSFAAHKLGGEELLLKFTASGKVDTHFANNGVLKPESATTFTVDPQGRILVGGFRSDPINDTVAIITRYTATGALDTSFHQFISANPEGGTFNHLNRTCNSIALDSHGYIFASLIGSDSSGGDEDGFAIQQTRIVRLGDQGQFDFQGDAMQKIRRIERVLDDDSIILAGRTIARFTPAGVLDTTYGRNGVANTTKGGLGPSTNLFSRDANDRYAVSADGSVIFANVASPGHLELTRINPHGQPDVSFGTNGTLAVATNSDIHAQDYLSAVDFAPDGSLVIGAQSGILSPTGKTDTRSFLVGRLINSAGPAVQLIPRTLKTPSTYLYVTVLIRDPEGVDVDTLDDLDLRLMDATGATRKMRFVGSEDVNGDGQYISARYRIKGPNGSPWSSAANGTYQVRLQRKQIADSMGNVATAQPLGTVRVNIA